jgi:hypothetical protein
MDIGRNEPCPCGSGKKYKRCCLAKDQHAARPPGQDLHELDHRLLVDMGTWARRRFQVETAEAYDKYPIDFGERDEHLPLFAAWGTYERKLEGRVLADWYLEERGRHLMTHERAWLTAEVDALLRDLKARHYATWPDDSLPALDGLTPREAAAQPKYRARLDTLLKQMEYRESQEPPGRCFDFGPIRRSLGLGLTSP